MQISKDLLKSVCSSKASKDRVEIFYPILAEFLPKYGISTYERERMFLAQILHESGEFRYTRELGSDKYLDKYDTGILAARLGNTPEDDDDGIKFCGRGLIQLTGYANYARFKLETGIDVIANSSYLETPRGAVHSACEFWKWKNLNNLCLDIRSATRRINGGTNGLQERTRYFNLLRKV